MALVLAEASVRSAEQSIHSLEESNHKMSKCSQAASCRNA